MTTEKLTQITKIVSNSEKNRINGKSDFLTDAAETAKQRKGSVGVGVASVQEAESKSQNAQIKTERLMGDIPEIVLDTTLHLPHPVGRTAVAVHLRPACDSGLHGEPFVVARDNRAVEERMGRNMGSGAYERHLPEEHVYQLRKFVNRCASQESTHVRDPGVAASHRIFVGVNRHRSEFVAGEKPAVTTCSELPVEHRSSGVDFDGHGHGNEHEWEYDESYGRADEVERAFYDSVIPSH